MDDITAMLRRSYDEAPYPGRAYAHTHPDYMAVLATLLGLNPPPVRIAAYWRSGALPVVT